LCKAIDSDDVLLSQLQNAHSFDVFEDDLTRLFMAELEALQDVPLFGPFSPEVMDYVKTLKEDTLFQGGSQQSLESPSKYLDVG